MPYLTKQVHFDLAAIYRVVYNIVLSNSLAIYTWAHRC